MNMLENYGEYCQMFKNGIEAEQKRVRLMWFLRSWFISRLNVDKSINVYSSLDEMTSALDFANKDGLSYIIDQVDKAVKYISRDLHEKILRENVLLPIHKVREINSYGINWLSKRNGRTVKEKLSSTKNMMAVNRRPSFDTGENRLFMACIKNLADRLEIKHSYLPEDLIQENEVDLQQFLIKLLRSEEMKEIRRWENLPPNNTLLSDRYYSKVWRAWNDLKKLDDIIRADEVAISERMKTFFATEMVHYARGCFSFVQMPVLVDYKNCVLAPLHPTVKGINDQGETITFNWRSQNLITVSFCDIDWKIMFRDTVVEVKGNNVAWQQEVDAENITAVLKSICTGIWKSANDFHYTNKHAVLGAKRVVMDLFGVRPFVKWDGYKAQKLPFRLMRQVFKVPGKDDEVNEYDISLDSAQAFMDADDENSSKVYSLSSAMHEQNDCQAFNLLSQLGECVQSDRFTFLFPDGYNDFQLSGLRKNIRFYYSQVESLPKSIAAVFAYEMKYKSFVTSFSAGDCAVVVNLVDNKYSFTLVDSYAAYGDAGQQLKTELPERKCIIWERHPANEYQAAVQPNSEITIGNRIHDKLLHLGYDQERIIKENYGVQSIACEKGELTICGPDDQWIVINDSIVNSLNQINVDISWHLRKFLELKTKFIDGKKIHVICLSSYLSCQKYDDKHIDTVTLLEGVDYYEKMASKVSISLWQDHLPNLAIKRFYGVFSLVENQKIEPQMDNVKKININKYFTLTKGVPSYHFKLQQDDGGESMQYEAVVNHKAFPLEKDIPCKLDMTYSYGADDPYTLIFRPVDVQCAGFREAKVAWRPVTDYKYDKLLYPEFPAVPDWSQLRSVPTKDGMDTSDLIEWFTTKLNLAVIFLEAIDFSQWSVTIKGQSRNVAFAYGEWNGKYCLIQINQNNCDEGIVFSEEGLSKLYCNIKVRTEKYYYIYGSSLSWFTPKNGKDPMALADVEIDGCLEKVAFYKNNFIFDKDIFSEDRLSFSVTERDGRYRATNIIATQHGNIERYFVADADANRSVIYTERIFNTASILFPAHNIFSNGRNIYSAGCPKELRETVQRTVPYLFDMYKTTKNETVRMNLSKLLCLLVNDITPEFYDVLYDLLEKYDGNNRLPRQIGYALGGCDTGYQTRLFNQLISLDNGNNSIDIMCILSLAAWKNGDFILNADNGILLKYFDIALEYLTGRFRSVADINGTLQIGMEYVLSMFRLRGLRNNVIDKHISLNNPLLMKFYKAVEDLIAGKKATKKSRITFEVHPSEEWKNEGIPDFMYAMLVYITGETGEGDIKITDISDSENGD